MFVSFLFVGLFLGRVYREGFDVVGELGVGGRKGVEGKGGRAGGGLYRFCELEYMDTKKKKIKY